MYQNINDSTKTKLNVDFITNNTTATLDCHYSIYYDFNTLIYQNCATCEPVHRHFFCCSYHFQYPFNSAQKITCSFLLLIHNPLRTQAKGKEKWVKKFRKSERNSHHRRHLEVCKFLNASKPRFYACEEYANMSENDEQRREFNIQPQVTEDSITQ